MLILFGALTGRDGIGGASVLASAELGESDAAKRPSVQIGDPFAEKKLLECCLELLDSELLVSLQDLGAAGLTSSAAEMASKGAVGLDIDIARVPMREAGMEPFEVMVSESQERMLCVVEPARVDEVLAVCARWETLATVIGEVNDSGRLRVLDGETVTADLPVGILVDDCPLYDLEPARADREPVRAAADRPAPRGAAGRDTARAAGLGQPGLPPARVRAVRPGRAVAHRAPARGGRRRRARPPGRQRDRRRRSTATAAGSPVIRARGAAEAVYECAANLACTGAEPLGLTNCLNFGNPEKPHVAWQLVESVEGIAEACAALDVPVVGGNVSLYNEAPAGPIFPTPVIGMVGRLPDAARAGRLGFAGDGDAIALVGSLQAASAAGSELSKLRGEPIAGPLPELDPEAIRATHAVVRDAVRAEAAGQRPRCRRGRPRRRAGRGLPGRRRPRDRRRVTLPDGVDPFGEAPGRAFVVSGEESVLAALPGATVIGHVGGERLAIDGLLDVAVSELSRHARARTARIPVTPLLALPSGL